MCRVDSFQKDIERYLDNMNGLARRNDILCGFSDVFPRVILDNRFEALTDMLRRNDIDPDDDERIRKLAESISSLRSEASDREIYDLIALVDQERSRYRERMNRGGADQP